MKLITSLIEELATLSVPWLPGTQSAPTKVVDRLGCPEQEVSSQSGHGAGSQEIASRLNVSERSV